MKKPELASGMAQKEVDRVEKQFNEQSERMQNFTQDKMQNAPVKEVAPQTEITKGQFMREDAPRITPVHAYPSRGGTKKPEQDGLRRKAWEYVRCICENLECPGEDLDFWLKPPLSGEDCNNWKIPVNKVVMIPRHVAEHLASRKYHRLYMDENITVMDTGFGQMKGQLTASKTVHRLNCRAEGF